jgi:TonB family protein
MGYQALLFCPDEKLARVVSQVFTELDFGIELVHEPFGAVKKLMAQRYDAVVVDCENEPNATLLFKSARNSSANQSSLAIAVVEGQTGVAKAYRIGANLVLTKPINVEQAKGTLRVARGLLRKSWDAAGANAAAPAAPVTATAPPASVPVKSVSVSMEPVAIRPANKSALPEFETPLPAMAASSKSEEGPVAVSAGEVPGKPPATVQPSAESQPPTAAETAKPPAAPMAAKAAEGAATVHAVGQGSAAAPALAREAALPEKKTVEFEAAYEKDDKSATFGSTRVGDGPSFAALEVEHADGSGGKNKILVAAAVVVALITLALIGSSKLNTPKTSVTSPAVSEPQPPAQPATPPAAAPISAPVTTPVTGTTNRAGANTQAGAPRTAVSTATPPAAAGSSPVLRIDVNPEPASKKTEVTPIVVKSVPAKRGQTEDAAAQLPSPLAVAASNEKGLSSLSMPSTRSQPTLAKIRISQGVSQGLLIKRVQPKYPQNGLAMHLQGAVQMEATIDKEGKIANLTVLKGDAMLARAAMEAVRQWRYKPYYLDGAPVDIQTQITVNFKLPN